MSNMIAKTGLLILTNPVQIGKILPTIQELVKNTLYIHLTSALHEPFGRYKPEIYNSAPKYSQTIRGIYSEVTALCQNLDVRVLLSGIKYSNLKSINTARPIGLVIFDKIHEKGLIDTFLNNCVVNKKPDCGILTLENSETQETKYNFIERNNKMYKHVVLGGTFDRLHIGHKMLLTEAILHAEEKVTIGVTDTEMLKSKILWELVEPCQNRIESVKNFVNEICPELTYDIVPIQDAFGPTQSDPTMNMIVVSDETMRGGEKVNEIRQQKGLNPLDIVSVELVDCPDRHFEEECKISSSTNRRRLLGTLLKNPNVEANQDEPYVIGLTGGIASGKTCVSERLVKLGAAVINCDKLAHDLYKPGQPGNKLIRENFGDAVMEPNGEVNRKALGAIVFQDEKQMQLLNNLLWPAMAVEVQKQIKELHASGYRVIVVDAAILVKAGWHKLCNEVWVCMVPPEEAITRMQNRNSLSETEAKSRLEAQSKNTDHVEHAHVVLSTLWSYDYTQMMVERAWKLLNERLNAKK